MRNLIVIASTIVAFVAAPAAARDASFVSADQTRALQILPAPAANDSERTKAELEELHRVETTRTAAETAQAVEDDRNEHIFVFKTVFGDAFSAEKLPGVAAFGKRVKNDEGVNSAAAKARHLMKFGITGTRADSRGAAIGRSLAESDSQLQNFRLVHHPKCAMIWGRSTVVLIPGDASQT